MRNIYDIQTFDDSASGPNRRSRSTCHDTSIHGIKQQAHTGSCSHPSSPPPSPLLFSATPDTTTTQQLLQLSWGFFFFVCFFQDPRLNWVTRGPVEGAAAAGLLSTVIDVARCNCACSAVSAPSHLVSNSATPASAEPSWTRGQILRDQEKIKQQDWY